jgi:excisionase family DNA binding protein
MSTEASAAVARLDWAELPRRLTVEETAAIGRVSDRSVRRWIALGYVRARKPAGGRVLVDRDSLRAFIEGESSAV